MKTILVTGAAGFIGARTVHFLLQKRHFRVVGVDHINDYYDTALKYHRLKSFKDEPRFDFVQADIEDKNTLDGIFQKHRPQAVINLAARAGVRYSVENPHIYMSTNIHGNLNLLELCRDYQVKKYVVASTSSLYAGEKMPFTEDKDVSHAISPYAASKKAAEVCAYTFHYLYGIDVSVLRYFTVYGPAGRPDMSPFRFIEWIERGETLQLFGDGTQKRDFTYVDDIAEGTILALKKVGYEIINLGNSKPYSMKQMIQKMEKKLGRKAKIQKSALPKMDMKHTWADIQKAHHILGWQPAVSFDEGLAQTIEWHQSNRQLLSNIKL